MFRELEVSEIWKIGNPDELIRLDRIRHNFVSLSGLEVRSLRLSRFSNFAKSVTTVTEETFVRFSIFTKAPTLTHTLLPLFVRPFCCLQSDKNGYTFSLCFSIAVILKREFTQKCLNVELLVSIDLEKLLNRSKNWLN